MGRPRKLIIEKLMCDEDVCKLRGEWIDDSYIKHPVIRENTDVYYKDEHGDLKVLLNALCLRIK